jgi:hypothetical protein
VEVLGKAVVAGGGPSEVFDRNAEAAMDALGDPGSKYQLSEYAATLELVPAAIGDWPNAAGSAEGVRQEIVIENNPKILNTAPI